MSINAVVLQCCLRYLTVCHGISGCFGMLQERPGGTRGVTNSHAGTSSGNSGTLSKSSQNTSSRGQNLLTYWLSGQGTVTSNGITGSFGTKTLSPYALAGDRSLWITLSGAESLRQPSDCGRRSHLHLPATLRTL